MDDDRKFGTCPMCKRGNIWLYFVKGWYHGNPWFGFLCTKCYEELKDNERRRWMNDSGLRHKTAGGET